MTDFLQYFYVFLWAALAVLTFFVGRKQGLYGYLLSLFFVFMTVWYGLRAFAGLQVFDGAAGIVFRVVLVVFLLVIAIIWIRSHRPKPDDKPLMERRERLFEKDYERALERAQKEAEEKEKQQENLE